MKFFSRELYQRSQTDDDAILDASAEEWEAALQRYEQHFQALEPALPTHIRAFQALAAPRCAGAVDWPAGQSVHHDPAQRYSPP